MIHRTATNDDKKLQAGLKKLGVNTIPGIEEVGVNHVTAAYRALTC